MSYGYPGNLAMEVSYQLSESNEVIITYKATTDKSTPVNLLTMLSSTSLEREMEPLMIIF